MKNIQVYPAPKYKQPIYTEVEPNIYAYTAKKEDTENCLSLCQVADPELQQLLLASDNWKDGTSKIEAEQNLKVLSYQGKRYYKDPDCDTIVFQNEADIPQTLYVTSLIFEQEPEYGENAPSDPNISQYPLEDLLDEFMCCCEDWYEQENANDPIHSYQEFSSPDLSDIQNLLSIVGKHVYNKERGDYVDLIIE